MGPGWADRVGAPQRLHAGLLIAAEHDRARRQADVQGADLGELHAELGVGAVKPHLLVMRAHVGCMEVAPRRARIERGELGMAVEDAPSQALAGPDIAEENAELLRFSTGEADRIVPHRG